MCKQIIFAERGAHSMTQKNQTQPTEAGQNPSGEKGLSRSLSNFNLQLIALGGSIGTGLFLGSSTAIKNAGPSILLAYIVSGIVVLLFMRAMGEILLADESLHSIGDFVGKFLGPRFEFLVTWTYWLCWISAALAEYTAIGIYVKYWFPEVPSLVSGLVALGFLLLINLSMVKTFGNLESVFSIIKLAVIILFVIFGIVLVVRHTTYTTEAHTTVKVGLDNLVSNGGFFPNGIKGFLLSFQMVLFGFAGIEMLGLTAGETKNESKNLKKAINALPLRLLLFYVGAIAVILVLIPWNEVSTSQSPFVSAFKLVGIPAAATIINFTVLIASLSSSNTAMYSTSRILYTGAKDKLLPAFFTKVSKKGIPLRALLFSSAIFCIGLFANFLVPDAAKLFQIIASITTVCFLFVWSTIVLSHLIFKKKNPDMKSGMKMPFYPISNYFLLAFFAVVFIFLFINPSTRVSGILGIIWFAALLLIYQFYIKKQLAKDGIKKESAVISAQDTFIGSQTINTSSQNSISVSTSTTNEKGPASQASSPPDPPTSN